MLRVNVLENSNFDDSNSCYRLRNRTKSIYILNSCSPRHNLSSNAKLNTKIALPSVIEREEYSVDISLRHVSKMSLNSTQFSNTSSSSHENDVRHFDVFPLRSRQQRSTRDRISTFSHSTSTRRPAQRLRVPICSLN